LFRLVGIHNTLDGYRLICDRIRVKQYQIF
jgi:hypothetical protein